MLGSQLDISIAIEYYREIKILQKKIQGWRNYYEKEKE